MTRQNALPKPSTRKFSGLPDNERRHFGRIVRGTASRKMGTSDPRKKITIAPFGHVRRSGSVEVNSLPIGDEVDAPFYNNCGLVLLCESLDCSSPPIDGFRPWPL